MIYLGCINKYLKEGYIPIVDLKSFNNIYNKINISINPWELFFYQPFNYIMDEVKRYAKNITYLICTDKFYRPNELYIYIIIKLPLIFGKNLPKIYASKK